MTSSVPAWPVIMINVLTPSQGTIRGRTVHVPPSQDIRQHLLAEACAIARSLGRPVRVRLSDPTGVTELIAHPRGTWTPITRPADVASGPRENSTPHPPPATTPTSTPPPPVPSASSNPAPGQEPGQKIAVSQLHVFGLSPTRRAEPAARVVRVSQRSTRYRPIAVAVLFCLVVAGAVIILVTDVLPMLRTPSSPTAATTSHSGPQTHSSTATPTPTRTTASRILSPSTLPTAANPPPEFATRPAWGHNIAAWTKIAILDGSVYTRTPNGTLFRIDAATGTATWAATGFWDSGWDGPRIISADGRSAVVLTTTTTQISWPVTDSPPLDPSTTPLPTPLSPNTTPTGDTMIVTTSRGRLALIVTGPAGGGSLLLGLPADKE
ncbi:MAG: hypothetical protein QG597_184 [Actinomycetota bacterium]|nr:hypothetical protein [Actinomycetota bacterium]